jgi:hypothetical protein
MSGAWGTGRAKGVLRAERIVKDDGWRSDGDGALPITGLSLATGNEAGATGRARLAERTRSFGQEFGKPYHWAEHILE